MSIASIVLMSPAGAAMIVAAVILAIVVGCIRLIAYVERGYIVRPRRVTKIIRSNENPEIIGDGAWIDHPPRSARVRDIGVRGA